MKFCIDVLLNPLFSRYIRSSILLDCKFKDLSIQPILQFVLRRVPQHQISLKMIPIPTMEPFVSLRGPYPGSEFIAQPTNPPSVGPFGNDSIAQIKVSPEVVWAGVGTSFPHLEEENDVLALKILIVELIFSWIVNSRIFLSNQSCNLFYVGCHNIKSPSK